MSRRWRKRLRYILIGLLVVPVTFFLIRREIIFAWNEDELGEAIAETERLDPHWRWDDLQANRAKVPDEENAVFQIRKVKELVGPEPRTPPERHGLYAVDTDSLQSVPPNKELRPEDRATLQAIVKEHADAVQAARGMAHFPRGRFPLQLAPDPLATKMGDIEPWRQVFQLLAYDVEHCTLVGNAQEAVTGIRTLLTSVQAFENEPTLIITLVRVAGSVIVIQRLERLLAMTDQVPDLPAVVEELNAASRDRTLYHGLRGERALMSVVFDRLLDGSHPSKNSSSNPLDLLGEYYFRSRVPADHAQYLRALQRMIDATQLPPHEQIQEYRRIIAAVPNKKDYPLTALLFPAVEKVAVAVHRRQALLRCARLGILAEVYRREVGRWPDSLTVLAKDFSEDDVADPFDGAPLRYRRTAYGAIVYSVGPDQVDDNGDVELTGPGRSPDVGFRLYDPDKRRQPAPNPPWFSDSAAHAGVGVGSGVLVEPGEFAPRR
jgi:hypothetical protein